MDPKRSTFIASRMTLETRTYALPVYRDYPANAVPVTAHFSLTASEAIYILDTAEQVTRLHFEDAKLLDARVRWHHHDVDASSDAPIERATITGAIVVTSTTFRFEGRNETNGPLLFTMPMRLDDLVRDFDLVRREKKAA